MKELLPGARGYYSLTVTAEHLANRFKDPTLPAVFSTPVMIMAMENAALAAITPYLDKGESAVGSRVDVRHLAATPVGRRVTAWAEVTGVSGRHLTFKVWALDGAEQIGAGTHERVLIDSAKFNRKIAQKILASS